MAKKRRNSTPGSSAPSEQSDKSNVGPWLAFAGTVVAAAITAYATLNNEPTRIEVLQQTSTASAPTAATPPAAEQPTSPPTQPAGSQGRPSASQPASDRPSAPGASRSRRSVAGTWKGTLTFGKVTQITIDFDSDSSFSITSENGRVASGNWSSGQGNAIHVDARHHLLGPFSCEFTASESAMTGECSSGGRFAGSIALTREPAQPSPVALVPRSVTVA
jgi:hypothetical protein